MTPKEMKERAFSNVYAALIAELRGESNNNHSAVMACAYQAIDLMDTEEFKWLVKKANAYIIWEKAEARKAHTLTEKEVTTIRGWFNDQIQKAQFEQVKAHNAHDKATEDFHDGREMVLACTKHMIRRDMALGNLTRGFERMEAGAVDHLNDKKWHDFKYGKYEGYKMIRHYLEAFEIKD